MPPLTLARQHARTARFTFGVPRDFTVSPDGARVVFLRSSAGDDPVNRLWTLSVATGGERLLVDPGAPSGGALPAAERARRERTRERAGGIVAYATDAAVTRAVYALDGALHTVDLLTGEVTALGTTGSDPRLDPAGEHVAHVSGGALHVDGEPLLTPDGPGVTWGLPEHVAAESMGRHRGYWWAPDGTRLLVARVDDSRVSTWHLPEPADPGRPPAVMAYPAAGTDNADVTLWLTTLAGERTEVVWDRAAFEYVAAVSWTGRRPLILVQSRDQRTTRVLEADPGTGATTPLREDTDDAWLQLVPGVPARTASGELVWTVDRDDTRRLMVGDDLVTPPGLQVLRILAVDGDTVLALCCDEPTERHLFRYSRAEGLVRVTSEPGVHTGTRGGGVTVVVTRTLEEHGVRVTVAGEGTAVPIASNGATPVVRPRVELTSLGERELRGAVVFPTGHVPGSRRLPVLLSPYAGPGGALVLRGLDDYAVPQWFADQGFAVLVVDGRGTPGRGPAWERAVHLDKLSAALRDQADALRAAAGRFPDLDLDRVAIRGWSYGGYLAAAAVLRHPEVFHAAVAGAPVTDARLYDTHWQERFLGHPDEHPEAYDRSSIVADAPNLRRPLMLVHGLADDNVFAAHTLRLSAALLAAGRPHTVLPLSGVTHMTSREEVAENLLLLELDFLRRALS
ncbi:prolyl oligopeptidase family serine peptidase [Nonomuraea sp. MCN248]|uniref:Prolyl oligopeptidase family serine peptidase n=1 Tax=Nonomuraea corallina TaxID=2989783 RepID=A0ABT4SAF5_9ACTN|nr:prolyl oligopeptidase family serine peptidase [Nonomuraea corallina]MDA0633926.1 prolyl oligopeptidase family serine peptidase [Nonomuraea corallina]